MARLISTIPLNITNDILGTIFFAGNPEMTNSLVALRDGRLGLDGRTFDADTILRGSGFNNPNTGTLTSAEIIFNQGEFRYLLDEFSVPVLQAVRALENGNNSLVQLVASGDDEFIGSSGRDLMRSFGGDDTIEGNGGDDLLTADAGDDLVFGGAGNDDIIAGGGNDTASGGNGADEITGGGGNDSLTGGRGADTLTGQAGTDMIFGGGGGDEIAGGGRNDTLSGNGGSDSIAGGGGSDEIIGGAGRDTLLGGGGDDVIRGNGGRDVINGGRGDDLMTGGGGRDTFVFQNNAGDDVINGFSLRRDLIDLSQVSDITDFDDLITGHASESADGVQIAISDSATLTISDVDLTDLSESLFIF